MTKLLIVDDDADVLLAARLLLKRHFDQVDIERNPNRLLFLLTNQWYDAILLDMNFARSDSDPTGVTRNVNSGQEGFHWLEWILDLAPSTTVVLFTAYGDVEMAVRAIKAGATDFVLKPWENDKLVATMLEKRGEKGGTGRGGGIGDERGGEEKTGREGRPGSLSYPSSPSFITHDPVTLQVLETVGHIAPTDANVLILGENGTGKDLLAREIHRQSLRRDGPFVAVDLGALTESLFESELFGHTKGAFTDARTDRVGRFEEAKGGTVFLDEIGNINLSQQARLLTVLQQRTVTRVGSNQPVPVDVRVICATNVNLRNRVHEGRFRQDLLYRINTIELQLPPLRDRPNDLIELANHFLQQYSQQYNRGLTGISPALMAQWQQHDWPGNVRELQHTIERAVILVRPGLVRPGLARPGLARPGLVRPDGYTSGALLELDSQTQTTTARSGATPVQETMQLEDMEKRLIQQALLQHTGNITEVARVLGLSRQALYRRMEKYSL